MYLAARSESRASAAMTQLAAEGLTKITWLKLDLDDPRDAQKAAQEFLRLEQRLDILSEEKDPWSVRSLLMFSSQSTMPGCALLC